MKLVEFVPPVPHPPGTRRLRTYRELGLDVPLRGDHGPEMEGEATFELVKSFPIEEICDAKNFKSLYYYYGIVTMGRLDFDTTYYRVPNECIRQFILRELHNSKIRANP